MQISDSYHSVRAGLGLLFLLRNPRGLKVGLKRRKLLLASLFLCFSSSAWSSIQTYGQALELALENNPGLASTYFDFAASRERVAVVEGELKPSLDVQAVRGKEDRITPSSDFGTYNKNDVRFTATQLVFDGFQTLDRVRAAEFEARRDLQGHIRASENAALEVTEAYLQVALFQRLKNFSEQNYHYHRVQEAKIEDRVRSGIDASVDLEQITARLALAESNVLTETTNLHDTLAELQRITGERVSVETLPLPLLPPELMGSSRDDVLRLALRQSPRVREATEEMLAVNAERDAARGPFFPRIDLRYRHEQSDSLDGLSGNFDTEAVELVFNFNFYRGGSDEAQRRERNQRFYGAMEARKQACWYTRREVLVAYNESNVLEKQVALLQVQLKAQVLARIAYDGERTLGKRSLLDVLDSQNEYFDTQRALARAKTGLILARAKALAEAGSLLAAFGVSIVRPESLDWQWDPALSSAYAQCPSVPTEAIDVDFEDIYDRLQRSAGS